MMGETAPLQAVEISSWEDGSFPCFVSDHSRGREYGEYFLHSVQRSSIIRELDNPIQHKYTCLSKFEITH